MSSLQIPPNLRAGQRYAEKRNEKVRSENDDVVAAGRTAASVRPRLTADKEQGGSNEAVTEAVKGRSLPVGKGERGS